MDTKKVDDIIAFALLAAGRGASPRERELGAIHLVKLVYMADLAFAERNGGMTFTNAAWTFHHFGPWSPEVWKRIAPVVVVVGAVSRVFATEGREDNQRWSIGDPHQTEPSLNALDRVLPFEVTSAVNRVLRKHGQATSDLLHEVYQTRPMLRAVPGRPLDFSLAPVQTAVSTVMEEPLTAKQEKQRNARLRALRERVQARQKARSKKHLVEPSPAPVYDEAFFDGVAWLDSLAGHPVPITEGEVHFADELWTEGDRGEPDGN